MKRKIREIIQTIPAGKYFDTHSIIDYLIKYHPEVYLKNFKHTSVELYNGYIGKTIGTLDDIVNKSGDNWSMNIKGEFSYCALWERKSKKIQINKIIECLDSHLKRSGLPYIGAPEANIILEKEMLLKDSASRQGLPLRRLLRAGLLPHAYQINRIWHIPKSQ